MTPATELITLSGAEIALLLTEAGLEPSYRSPLLGVGEAAGELDAEHRQALVELGWLSAESPARLSASGREVFETLCVPTGSARLLFGTRRALGSAGFYTTLGEGAYASLVHDRSRDEYRVTEERSLAELADLMAAQLLIGPLDSSLAFTSRLRPDELAALLGVLDWRTRRHLEAALDRLPTPEVRFDAGDIWGMLTEGRLADDLAWQVTLFQFLLPFLDLELPTERVEGALRGLASAGLIRASGEGDYGEGEALRDLAEALLPVGSFAALHVDAWSEDTLEGDHYAFLRGPFTLVGVHPVLEGEGPMVVLEGLSDVQVADILFELGLGRGRS